MKVGFTYNMKVVFTYNMKKDSSEGDLYAEWDEEETIDAVVNALSTKHDVIPIEANLDAFEKLKKVKPEIVFNTAEGFYGPSRESQIPAILEMLQIPYTGSDPITLGICLEKSRAKEILNYYKIPTPNFILLNKEDYKPAEIKRIAKKLKFPVIVKPAFEGSSKGINNDSLVHTIPILGDRIERVFGEYNQSVLIEEFLKGREFTVALWGNGKEVECLPIVELNFEALPREANKLYSYEAKWVWDTVDKPLDMFKCPANLDRRLEKKIKDTCVKAFNALKCKDWCRIDVRLDLQEKPYILELNPLPGILPNPDNNSCFPKAARAAGFNYEAMINNVLDIACKRYGILK